MARKTTKTRKRKATKSARGRVPVSAQKRTSMWLGEDLLAASAKEAKRLGISRSLWVQMTLRLALGMPTIPTGAAPKPAPTTDNSVFA